ncbi:MAG: Phosphoribosyltransferase [Leptospirillum sp. Group IV 'UBA BS']|nr:MAG: Phosphoribosyltransferase [Leptospirillum sp. Group IV 'UBA BS']
MGEILARELSGDLDIVMVRKIGAPGDPEFAIGAVDENGDLLLSPFSGGGAFGNRAGGGRRGTPKGELSVIRERRRLWGKGRPASLLVALPVAPGRRWTGSAPWPTGSSASGSRRTSGP